MRWVRPGLTRSAKTTALADSELLSCSRAGSRVPVAASRAARWTADGNTSLDDWPMLTWSFGWTPSPARVATTSLTLMLVEVPEPVWKTSMGNCSSCPPPATASAAAAMRPASSSSSSPSSALTRAASALMRASARTTSTGTRSPEIGKFAIALSVSPRQSFSIVPLLAATRLGATVALDLWPGPRLDDYSDAHLEILKVLDPDHSPSQANSGAGFPRPWPRPPTHMQVGDMSAMTQTGNDAGAAPTETLIPLTADTIQLDGRVLGTVAGPWLGAQFEYTEADGLVHVRYSGGHVRLGYRVGTRTGNHLAFRYAELSVT